MLTHSKRASDLVAGDVVFAFDGGWHPVSETERLPSGEICLTVHIDGYGLACQYHRECDSVRCLSFPSQQLIRS